MKKKAFLVAAFILTLLFSAAAGLKFTNLASGNPWGILGSPPSVSNIYIRSDGSVEPSTAPIQQVGNVYTFTKDILNSTIIVQRDNITIDGMGFALQGNGYYEGITLSGRSNVTIKNIDISQVSWGINMTQASHNIITGNKISGAYGIYFGYPSSDSNQIVGNTISCGSGVSGLGSFNNIIGNNFVGSDYGVEITGNNNTVSRNSFDNDGSIKLGGSRGSHYNTISENTMAGGRYGIYIYAGSSHNVVCGNTITFKNECGIKIDTSFSNIVYGNSLVKNEIGIYVGNPAFQNAGYPYSTDNTFYHNNFVDNIKNVHIEQGIEGGPRPNFWDNGKEGNYWSNYTGRDSNGDGIGDTPYLICDKNADRYPLMNPIDLSRVLDPDPPTISIVSPENMNYTYSNVSLTFIINEPTSWMGYSLDGQGNVTIAGNTTLLDLSDGSHRLTVYANDTAGNMGASETVSFSVAQKVENEQAEPLPTTLVAAASVSAAVVSASLLAYFKKRNH